MINAVLNLNNDASHLETPILLFLEVSVYAETTGYNSEESDNENEVIAWGVDGEMPENRATVLLQTSQESEPVEVPVFPFRLNCPVSLSLFRFFTSPSQSVYIYIYIYYKYRVSERLQCLPFSNKLLRP